MKGSREISGKKFVPMAAVGCLVFAAVLGFGTYLLGVWTTPLLKKRTEDYLKHNKPPKSAAVPASPASNPVAR